MHKKTILISLLCLIAVAAIGFFTKSPIEHAFEYNTDEGINLIKSTLLMNGFSLYKEIFNDQPPLLPLILSFLFKLFGTSICLARCLILIFSVLLLLAFHKTIRIKNGFFCSCIAVLFLILSNRYIRLSVSVMIGIVSVSFAMLSIMYLTIHKKFHNNRFLILSGILMALSLQTKLFTVFLIPIIISEIILNKKFYYNNTKTKEGIFSPIILWSISLISVYLLITIYFFNFNLQLFIDQQIKPHLAAYAVKKNSLSTKIGITLADYDIIALAVIGVLLILKQKNRHCFLLISWLAFGGLLLANHHPFWGHHYLLISPPICWLAAITFTHFFKNNSSLSLFKKRKSSNLSFYNSSILLNWITGVVILLTIFRLPFKFAHGVESIWKDTNARNNKTVELLLKYKKNTNWIVTDRPIFAFYADMLIPPELAFTSTKRNFNDKENQKYFINKIKEYTPEIILLNRLHFYGPNIIPYIETKYIEKKIKLDDDDDEDTIVKLYLRSDIFKKFTK